MIGEDTELINLDEASVDMMDIDDWKIMTQGGWTAHDRKWKSAKGFINKAPIFITCQKDLDFGSEEDNAAMDNRLNRYFFKTLPEVKKEAAKWIQSHPMNCIVWAAEMCGAKSDTDDEEVLEEEVNCFDKGLSKKDKVAILSLSLDDAVDEQAQDFEEGSTDPVPTVVDQVIGTSQDENQESHDSAEYFDDDDDIPLFERAKLTCAWNLGKGRMIDGMIAQIKARQNVIRREISKSRKAEYKRRQEHLRSLGVDESLLEMLPRDPRSPRPTPLRQEIAEKKALQDEAEEKVEEERIKQVFESSWLHNQELKMAKLQREIKGCSYGDVKRAKQYLLDTFSDALNNFHKRHKTPKVKAKAPVNKSTQAKKERKKKERKKVERKKMERKKKERKKSFSFTAKERLQKKQLREIVAFDNELWRPRNYVFDPRRSFLAHYCDENIVAGWFQQRTNMRNVSIWNLHARIRQIQ
ncbi:hypothetical protein QZH41_003673 [Actinostola sp. cb2023]|nr:hypothetical protein QZH41_003673 [Actinostola sp. cb2023]